MRLEYPEGVKIICFVDDAALVDTGQTTCLRERAMNDSLERVEAWMAKHGLTLSSSKSTAVMLTTKRDYVKPTFRINGVEITLNDSVCYLGVQLSSVLGFGKHVETASDKAMNTVSALTRLMPNVGGINVCGKKEVAIHSGTVPAIVCLTHMVQCAASREVQG